MAQANYTPTLSTADVNKIWRKVQGKLKPGIKYTAEEYEMLDELPEYDVDISAREVTVPVDIVRGAGVASIPEGGWEAVPSSPNLEELALNFILLNKRFTATKHAKYLGRRNAAAQIMDQIKFQGMKAVETVGLDFSDRFYGFSTGVLASVATTLVAGTSHTLALTNGYGLSTITNGPLIADKFVKGDRVALIRAGALVAGAIGTVTNVTRSNANIDVTWAGSAVPTAGDFVVKANSMENETLAGTDFNKGLVGILDMMTSTSVHNLSSATVPDWSIAYSDVTAGQFTGMKLHRARTELQNVGSNKGITILMAGGVERNLISQNLNVVRFADPMGMEIDGSIKSKGVTFKSTRRVPNGYVFGWVNGSINKITLIGKPNQQISWGDGKEMQNQSAFIFTMDFPVQLVVTNRKNLFYFSGQTES